jgi:hypothetical protein
MSSGSPRDLAFEVPGQGRGLVADNPAGQQGAPCRLRIRHGDSIGVDRLAPLEGTLELKGDLHRGAVVTPVVARECSAPPHAISRPHTSPNGTLIAPAPPRTGMPSAMIGKAVARNIVDMIGGADGPTRTASVAEMGATWIASAGANPPTGTAASMTVFPIVPDFERYPEYGRDQNRTFGEIGLAGHWIKILRHHLFLYKARLRPGWPLIPE